MEVMEGQGEWRRRKHETYSETRYSIVERFQVNEKGTTSCKEEMQIFNNSIQPVILVM
jgi:hypothetical protein